MEIYAHVFTARQQTQITAATALSTLQAFATQRVGILCSTINGSWCKI